MLAVELAVRRARIGTRLAFAILWSVAASLVFVAVFVLLMDHAVPLGRSSLAILGVVLIWLAVWTGGTLFYLLRRIRDLARLEALKASLVQED
jgi:threonine/homoserine/homoserine lactone efflux protein